MTEVLDVSDEEGELQAKKKKEKKSGSSFSLSYLFSGHKMCCVVGDVVL